MNKSLSEKLNKHLSKAIIESNADDIAKVTKLINSLRYKEEKTLAKTLLDCCKTGKFVKSAKLITDAADFAVFSAGDLNSDDDGVEALIDNLEDVLIEDEWQEYYLADTVGYSPEGIGYKLKGLEIEKAWEEGVKYLQDQYKAIYNKALPIAKKLVKENQ